MKIVVTLENPPPKAAKVRASKKKECVEICSTTGLRSLSFSTHGDTLDGKIIAGSGDSFDVLHATASEVRVLCAAVLKVGKLVPASPPAAEENGEDDNDFDPDLDTDLPRFDDDEDGGL